MHGTLPTLSHIDLIHGDCLEVMRTLEAGLFDLSFFSPPYNMREGSSFGKTTGTKWKNAALRDGYTSYSDDMPYPEYVAWQKDVLREVWRLTADDGAIFYQHKPRTIRGNLRMPTDLLPDELRPFLRQIVVWDRSRGFNFNASFFLPTYEWIVIIAKPKWRLKSKGATVVKDIWRVSPDFGNDHPAPFPVELPRMAVEATNAKTIFDPFMGSGSTALAAIKEGRDFVGIELDEGYLDKAAERIGNATPAQVRVHKT